MSIEKAVETTIQILDGLEFLHSRNIIHRDLKPANILLQGSTPRLADFGISRAMKTTVASQSQNISGTFAYMSPEALDGKRSVQTDIWSAGVNLYQFLTGTLPFPNKEPSVLFFAIMMREFVPLPDFVPSKLKEIIAGALAKSPENRYKTVGEMREDLRRLLVTFSFPQLAPTEVLPKKILSENIPPPVTPHNKTVTCEAEKAPVPDAKPADHLTAAKPFYAPDSIATRISEKDSFITQIPAVKTDEPQILPAETQAFAERTHGGEKNNFLFPLIGTGALIVLAFIAIISYSLNNSDGPAAANKFSNENSLSNANMSSKMTNVNQLLNTTANSGDADKNSIEIEFVNIPPGSFMMGSTKEDNEKPVHKVIISKGFQMSKTEITQAQWETVMGSNPSFFKNCQQCPVEYVSWNDAQQFITKLNGQNDGYKYRLPTEAEWEYACRAGTTGDYAGSLDEMAWYGEKSDDKTHPVGTKQPNAWGLYDMHGNVMEWVQDRYDEDYYAKSPMTDPAGPDSGSFRTTRGGGWRNTVGGARLLRSTTRAHYDQSFNTLDLGFRVARQ